MRIITALFFLLIGCNAVAAPAASLWDYWLAHQSDDRRGIDHGAWNLLLKRYVVTGADTIARFRYGTVTPADRALLKDYVEQLSRQPVRQLNRAEQRALWINLYNALTVQVVLDHYPAASIREIRISPGPFSSGPWGKKLLAIEGESVSLDDIEHRILRPIWRDPRLHYALNCASLGCPDLQAEAFTAANTEILLERAARRFVNHPRAVQVGRDGGLRLSSIYIWFREDFGGSEEAVLGHLSAYAEPSLREALASGRITGDFYDWSLNGAD